MKDAENREEEEFIDEEEAEHPAASIKKLRERLARALEEKQEYLDGWQRARADFANYKRAQEERSTEYEERITADLIEQLLPILDSLELSVSHADEKSKKGLSGMHQQFLSALKRFGVEAIEAQKGQRFDHRLHEALREEEIDDKNLDHAIINVERGGYALGDRVIRPAQVTVGVFKE